MLLGALLLAGCDPSGTIGGGGTSAPTTTAAATPTPTHAPLQAGDTSLCNTVSLAEFGQAVGGTVTTLIPGAKRDPASQQESVSCLYLSQQQPGVGGAIFYFVVNDGAAYYATARQNAAQSATSVTDQSGVGDEAFWDVPNGNPPRVVLAVLKGNLFFTVLVAGAPSTGLPATTRIGQLIVSRL
jgi:hypothetical protein